MKKYGGTEDKVQRTIHFSQREAPSVHLFFFRTTTNKLFSITSASCNSTSFGQLPRRADTVQCPAQTKQKLQNITPFAAMVEWPAVGIFGREQKVCVYGLNLSSSVSMFVLTRALFANNEILSAVSTEFERKEYLAKMNYYPNTWRGAPRGAGPPEARGPKQPHRLHRLKAAPGYKHLTVTLQTHGLVEISRVQFVGQSETDLRLVIDSQSLFNFFLSSGEVEGECSCSVHHQQMSKQFLLM